jgi:hypothetical protein
LQGLLFSFFREEEKIAVSGILLGFFFFQKSVYKKDPLSSRELRFQLNDNPLEEQKQACFTENGVVALSG